MSPRLFVVPLALTVVAAAFADVRDAFHREMPPSIAKPGEAREPVLPLSPNTIVGRVIHRSDDGKIAILLIDRGLIYRDTVLVARDHECRPKAVLRPIPVDRPSAVVAVAVAGGAVKKGDEVVIPGASLEKQARALFTPEARESAEAAATTTPPENPPSPASGR